ncbi:MAG: binding-protein-dependent transport system inner rane component, partial [Thermomicrobiales bacterium]|nr:binding-protein-dependent transport system inner rane component [Thermomicrobiales bacterium]
MSTTTSPAATNITLPVTTRRKVKWGELTLASVSHLLLIVLSLIAILPLAWAISSAFKSNSDFRFVLDQTDFPQWLRNSLIVSLSTTLLSLVVGRMAGYAMSRWRFRGRGFYGNTLLIVQMFPGVMLGIPLFLLLSNYGMIDTLGALLVTYLTFALSFSFWMLKGYFDNIPREIEEAALTDGANRFQVLYQI